MRRKLATAECSYDVLPQHDSMVNGASLPRPEEINIPAFDPWPWYTPIHAFQSPREFGVIPSFQ